MTAGLEGAIDLHVHCSPDSRPRKTTAPELVRLAQAAGMRGLLLKNHDTSTAPLAEVMRETVPGFSVFGGLVLNYPVGGWNPSAVDAAIRMGAKCVWMPTNCAEQERKHHGRSGTGLSALDPAGNLLAEIREILSLIAQANAILATGHLAEAEIRALVQEARSLGVRKILINHPEIRYQQLTEAFQREIAGPDVFFERCFARAPLFTRNWDELAAVTRSVGWRSTVLATDMGQPENPDPVSGLAAMRAEFASRGFSASELDVMMCETPARLLDLV
jgi:hypothetical protein